MAIEMRQQMKMSQQLVMTPQLQQAIKLLQLSRLELQDVVRQELEENPILDEVVEQEEIREPEQLELREKEVEPEAAASDFQEVRAGEETRETDWDSYIDGYNYSSGEQYYDDEDRPSFENLLTKKSTLFDHLIWQLSLTRLTDREMVLGAEIIGNIDEDGYFRASLEDVADACVQSTPFREELIEWSGLDCSAPRERLAGPLGAGRVEAHSGFRPGRGGGPRPARVSADPGGEPGDGREHRRVAASGPPEGP